MEIVFESTQEFEKELARFSETERQVTIEQINQSAQLFLTEKSTLFRKLRRLHNVKLINDYESTLYSLKVTDSIRVILTIDEDPIFEQVIFTLFRVVRKSLASQAYEAVAALIYADFRVKENKIGHHFQDF
ncbi:MAG: hypothetical protein DRR16_00985 [Candidatus Parabeggiatoa sp. nov. 3]|nr:MAG: hypothetical protein DRR00_11080 [Gammaproteobacteria bacterium]RKZ67266.1 MAG: hypothetical protein DRQ99_07195 [Gammaproteobacteria bacterium]RKZ89983.1 MAG: hypothetical protein DRR16_00985 [Gammaproteobacteria bacterium]